MIEQHRAERCNSCSGCDEYRAPLRMPQRKVAERLVHFYFLAGTEREQIGREQPVWNAVQAERELVTAARGGDGIGTSNLFAVRLLQYRDKLAWRKGQFLASGHFKVEVMHLRRQFFPTQQLRFQKLLSSFTLL